MTRFLLVLAVALLATACDPAYRHPQQSRGKVLLRDARGDCFYLSDGKFQTLVRALESACVDEERKGKRP